MADVVDAVESSGDSAGAGSASSTAAANHTGYATATGTATQKSRSSARVLRYASLLYTVFFFIDPYFRHSLRAWLWAGAFYAVFLFLYFRVTEVRGPLQRWMFAAQFSIAFAYYPFNSGASAAFVYPAVMLAFVIRGTIAFAAMLVGVAAGILLETWYFHLTYAGAGTAIFFLVVIGFSNLAYSRQQEASELLQRANTEIEHLAKVAERERIARDLHDVLGHTLTLITIKAELAGRLLHRDPQRAGQEIKDVEQAARNALAEVRETVSGYRSDGLDAELLRARRTLLAAGVDLTTEVTAFPLSASQVAALGLCVREATTNIARHAQATACSVVLNSTEAGVALRVSDNGRGVHGAEGNGLRGMKERVRSLQGRLLLNKAPEGGTCLNVWLPSTAVSPQVATINSAVQE